MHHPRPTESLLSSHYPAMGSKADHLHMLFFPFMAQGHMLPMVDMAKIFAARGARVTILTTPANATIIFPSIDDSVHIHIIPFPTTEFGLPDGCENESLIQSDDQHNKFMEAMYSLRHPFDSALRDLKPDCVVTDTYLPWTYHVAIARGILRLIFHGNNNFSICAQKTLQPCHRKKDNDESIVLHDIPYPIEMLKPEVDINVLEKLRAKIIRKTLDEEKEVESKSYGTLVNSFYELESEYADQHRKIKGRVWNVGPVSLCNMKAINKSTRGGEYPASIKEYLKWLDKKSKGSVVYICFGSGSFFSVEQLREIALGLEESRHSFIWVVRNKGDCWIPEGYEERIKDVGMVIKGWAPQLTILNHNAVGGFVTHCGWNSCLEGICAGLPMVTWPLYADQFFNEKLLVDILKIGVMVGSKMYTSNPNKRPTIGAAAVMTTIMSLMGDGIEAERRRRKAKELGEMAKRAMDTGGSSYEEIGNLMHELMEQKKHV